MFELYNRCHSQYPNLDITDIKNYCKSDQNDPEDSEYIDYIDYDLLPFSVLFGHDKFGRKFIVIKVKIGLVNQHEDLSHEIKYIYSAQTYFQRYVSSNDNWTYSGTKNSLFKNVGLINTLQTNFLDELISDKRIDVIPTSFEELNKLNFGCTQFNKYSVISVEII